MQWLYLSEGINQLFSLILKLRQVKTSEKSSEKSDFRVKRKLDFCGWLSVRNQKVRVSKKTEQILKIHMLQTGSDTKY